MAHEGTETGRFQQVLAGAGPPEPQVVGVVGIKAGDGVVVGHGLYDLASHPPGHN